MTLKNYMFFLLKHDKECYRRFLRFLIYYDAYEEFSTKIAERGKGRWEFKYWSKHYANTNLSPDLLIMNAFPWNYGDRVPWQHLSEEWRKQAPFRKLIKNNDDN